MGWLPPGTVFLSGTVFLGISHRQNHLSLKKGHLFCWASAVTLTMNSHSAVGQPSPRSPIMSFSLPWSSLPDYSPTSPPRHLLQPRFEGESPRTFSFVDVADTIRRHQQQQREDEVTPMALGSVPSHRRVSWNSPGPQNNANSPFRIPRRLPRTPRSTTSQVFSSAVTPPVTSVAR